MRSRSEILTSLAALFAVASRMKQIRRHADAAEFGALLSTMSMDLVTAHSDVAALIQENTRLSERVHELEQGE